MCISPTCCIIEQKIAFLYCYNPFFICHSPFLFIFYFSVWICFPLCIHGAHRGLPMYLLPAENTALQPTCFFLSISLERIVLYLVDHPCVKLVYHFTTVWILVLSVCFYHHRKAKTMCPKY